MAEIGTTRRSGTWQGWITFAAVLLCVLGVLNILEGLVALVQRQITFINGDSLIVVNLIGYGVVLVVFGALLTLAGIGLFARNPVARIAAIVISCLHVLTQISSIGAFPVWSILMIALDVIIIYALTVHWVPREIETAVAPAVGGVHRADRDQQPREAAFPMNPPRGTPAHSAEYPQSGEYQQAGEYPPVGEHPEYQRPGQPTPGAGPYPPSHGTGSSSSSSSAAPTSGHGTGAA
ncbi:hypothetical protein AB0M46_29110 [Dactylosporangium sp. NPDC051485]|uniref:DUF7144 family membrane protein n=1 Tax=Dactylosporangium sp. NPDC051485 TaxID=3154846 RepID=UPI0034241E44